MDLNSRLVSRGIKADGSREVCSSGSIRGGNGWIRAGGGGLDANLKRGSRVVLCMCGTTEQGAPRLHKALRVHRTPPVVSRIVLHLFVFVFLEGRLCYT